MPGLFVPVTDDSRGFEDIFEHREDEGGANAEENDTACGLETAQQLPARSQRDVAVAERGEVTVEK